MGKDLDLIDAVKEQDVALIQKIIQKAVKPAKNKIIGNNKKFNINHQDDDGMSALHQAALMGNTDIMRLLLEASASVELRDNKGMVALHYAAWQGKTEPVRMLLRVQSPINEQSLQGETPIHLASQHGHFHVVTLLLQHHADPTIGNKEHKSALDLAAEFGRYRVVELLLQSRLCQKLLEDSPTDTLDNTRTTALHLASRNGHIEVIRLLLQAGMNINRSTLKGTCLHEAALYGKVEVVKLLLDCGIDVNKPNSYDQTALDIVNKFTTTRGAKELKDLLKEASFAVQARAVKDFCNIYDPQSLAFKEGDIITVLEQRADGIWKGSMIHEGKMAQTGLFPANHVVLVDSQALAKQRGGGRCPVPVVPDLLSRGGAFLPTSDSASCSSNGTDDLPPPPSPLAFPRSPTRENADIVFTGSGLSPYHVNHHHHQYGVGRVLVSGAGGLGGDGEAGDMRAASPAKDGSPLSSNRNSAASSDSGRGVSTGHLEPKVAPYPGAGGGGSHHRLSGQSYESGVSSRQSYHSTSSSSVGSLDRLEEPAFPSTFNVADHLQAGVPDHEVLQAWLRELHFEEYLPHFAQAGYDMPTISRMTPEDLTAIGITKPAHRKRLKAEIARLNIHDGIPDYKPNDLLEWLSLLGLQCYYDTLVNQGYDNIDYIPDITWEDLEEIGIKRLGHQKKVMLAIDRLKRIMASSKRLSSLGGGGGDLQRSLELLEPPPSPAPGGTRWSGDMLAMQGYEGGLGGMGVGAKPKKSSSGESISTNSSGGSGHTPTSDEPPVFLRQGSTVSSSSSYQPDLVAIQVKRSTSHSESGTEGKDMAGQPITYQSFQGPNNRRSSDNSDLSPTEVPGGVSVAPVGGPKVLPKPKPVAKIVAKTKRSSREVSPELGEADRREVEAPPDGSRSPAAPGASFFQGGSAPRQEHIYDKPVVNAPPPATNAPPPTAPKPSPQARPLHAQAPAPGSPGLGPGVPLFVATHHDGSSSPQTPSPTGRTKKAPPPPPKRTHSIRSEAGPAQVQQEARPAPPVSPKPQLAAARAEVAKALVRPPPPTAAKPHIATPPKPQMTSPKQQIATPPKQQMTTPPKQHTTPTKQQGTPTKQPMTPPKVAEKPTVRPAVSSHHQQQQQQQAGPHLEPQQQAFASCVKSLSVRFGKGREEDGSHSNHSSDSEEFPPPPPPVAMDIITPKIHNYGIPSRADKTERPEYAFQGKVRREFNHMDNLPNHGDHHAPPERTFGSPLRKHVSPPREVVVPPSSVSVSASVSVGAHVGATASGGHSGVTAVSEAEAAQASLAEKRSESTASFESTASSTSVDSNTLPFANENVGTIKQRTPAAKPSIVQCEEVDGDRSVDLKAGVFGSSPVTQSFPPPSAALHGHVGPSVVKKPQPPVPAKMSASMTEASPSRLQRNTETGDVLCDIDNMLQDLTEELDAMLDEESAA